MTAFSRVEGAFEAWRWVWEIRSVNGRGLELRFRMPPGFEGLEANLRKIAQKSLNRGTVNIGFNMKSESSDANIRVNEPALQTILQALRKVQLEIDCGPPSADGILALRGVLEVGDGNENTANCEKLNAVLAESFASAIALLADNRRVEGAALEALMRSQLDEAETLIKDAIGHAAVTPAAIKSRIQRQLSELLRDEQIAEERLAQEAALMAVRADIREELDRLTAHVEAGRALLDKTGAKGREFDFLVQEFNREANTLCSKASDMELKRIGLDLKKVIDQMREQVQNVE